MINSEEQTTKRVGFRETRLHEGRWLALVICEGETTRYLMPKSGETIIGRGSEANIRIDHVSVSRMHARFNLSDKLTVEDLGSSNGTAIRDIVLEPNQVVEVFSNEVIEIGIAMVVMKKIRHLPRQRLTNTAAHLGIGEPQDKQRNRFGKIVLVNDEMRRIHRLIERVAKSDLNVLLLGETGVGKEVYADLIHTCSLRAEKPIVRVNCSAFPETLLESELFGHMRGAFSGADRDKPGILETGDGGTVFIDEVGDLSPNLQIKLLRAIENRSIQRIGSVEPQTINVRFVSATNSNLEEKIRNREFREDFYYRLNGITILIPPICERMDEIQPLAEEFVRLQAQRLGLQRSPTFSQAAIDMLLNHKWPGNVRELRNVVERGTVLCHGVIEPEHLAIKKMSGPARITAPKAPAEPDELDDGRLSDKEQAEKRQLLTALESCAGNQTKAAKQLGISRSTLVRRLVHYGVRRPQKG